MGRLREVPGNQGIVTVGATLALALAACWALAAEPEPGFGERPGTTAPMVRVPAGSFSMGCNERVDRLCFHDEGKGTFEVFLDEFEIDRHEVTVTEYAACVDHGWCDEPDFGGACNWLRDDRLEHPVNCVDWYQARDFCMWSGKRLPTEAEWEKAARGRDGRAYPWGNAGFAGPSPVANVADVSAKRRHRYWAVSEHYDDGFAETAPVESFPGGRSPYGAHDMVGNVWEWVADWYDEHYYRRATRRNPRGPQDGEIRVVRGGSWYNFPHLNRIGYRGWYLPDSQFVYLGFRCAR